VSETLLVPLGGTRLVADRWTGGGPVVVLLHAGVADRRGWREVAEKLARSAAVVTYDRRGHGESPPPSVPFSHVGDLLAVLDAIEADRAWLVGSSMGGGVALDAALVAPDRVSGLVLIAPAVSGAPEPALDPETQLFDERISRAAAAGDLDEVNRLETWLWLDGPAGSEGRVGGRARELALEMNAMILRHGVSEDAGASGINTWNRLEEVQVPTMVACGDQDVPFLVTRSQELARRLPRGRYRVLEDAAHLPFLEDPGAVASLVEETIQSGPVMDVPEGRRPPRGEGGGHR
jgi:pimeloyl-ACP methyl ester carboxylesterase